MRHEPNESDWESRWKSSLDRILELMKQSLQELPLSAEDLNKTEENFWPLFWENLPHFVAGTVLLSALGRFQESDSHYFSKQGLANDVHDDLSQEVDLKLFASLKRCWTTGNIGAFRAAVRRNLLNDQYRRQSSEDRHREANGVELDTFPARCNPLRSGTEDCDREGAWLLESIESSPKQVQQIVALIMNDVGWNEIARQLNLASGREAKSLVREALSPKRLW